jgi:farnesyl diphosphate synthase
MADEQTHADAAVRAALVCGLARAAGAGGMVGGQMLDLAAEGRYGEPETGEAGIRRLQAMKTGALIAFAVTAGALVGGADAAAHGRLAAFGRAVGAAFQIADDILDREAAPEQLGKTAGKDLKADKATYPSLYGLEKAAQIADQLVAEACDVLAPYTERANVLKEIALYLVQRKK